LEASLGSFCLVRFPHKLQDNSAYYLSYRLSGRFVGKKSDMCALFSHLHNC
jgi:hypothetical protein